MARHQRYNTRPITTVTKTEEFEWIPDKTNVQKCLTCPYKECKGICDRVKKKKGDQNGNEKNSKRRNIRAT